MLQVFDQPVMETNCTRRAMSTVSSQALTLLNSDFMVQAADAFAARVLKENAEDPAGHALRLAFARPPTDRERTRLQEFLKAQSARHAAALGKAKSPEALRRALVDLCHMLLSTNEFAYVD